MSPRATAAGGNVRILVLNPNTTEAVKGSADQLNQQLIRTVPESSTANTMPLPLAPW